jgi:CheY-like chemotaxis protein
MAAALRRALRGEGIVTDVAAGGEEALRLARSREPDAVVLDVMLPDIDGFETCRRLRAEGVWSPIIMSAPALLRARAPLRRRREPRAAHPGRGPEDRARGRPAHG